MNTRGSRVGFTLLEVLLALALTTVLIGSLLSALVLYQRMSTAGRSDVQHARLARALHERFRNDIRSVVFRPEEDEESAEESNSSGGAAEEPVEEDVTYEVTDPADAYANGSVGLVGDATTLVVHTIQPRRATTGSSVDFATLAGEGNATSDLRSVSYFLAVRGAAGLAGIVADRLAVTSPANERADLPLGLVRMEGDRLSMSLADDTGDLESLAAGAQLAAEEVKSLRFRYYDGTAWYDEWDSVTYAALPRAVEIVVGIRVDDEPPEDEQQAYGTAEPEPPIVEHTIVVALPQSDPTPIEEVLP